MVALLKMPGSYKLDPSERRMFTRKEIQARIEGKRLDHSVPARQQPHVSLALRDLSLGGLSALSEQPLGTGERVAIYFPPQGVRRGWYACRRVTRNDTSHFAYLTPFPFYPLPPPP